MHICMYVMIVRLSDAEIDLLGVHEMSGRDENDHI